MTKISYCNSQRHDVFHKIEVCLQTDSKTTDSSCFFYYKKFDDLYNVYKNVFIKKTYHFCL